MTRIVIGNLRPCPASPVISTPPRMTSCRNRERMGELVARARRPARAGPRGRRRDGRRAPPRRAASCSPASGSSGSSTPARAVPRALAARRPRPLRRRGARRRASSPASARSPAARASIVANDATVKGGSYFPITVKKHLRAQEIARAEPPALHLPGRLRRRLPAAPGRRLPRPRPLRPHLLQPGPHVGRAASPRSRS